MRADSASAGAPAKETNEPFSSEPFREEAKIGNISFHSQLDILTLKEASILKNPEKAGVCGLRDLKSKHKIKISYLILFSYLIIIPLQQVGHRLVVMQEKLTNEV